MHQEILEIDGLRTTVVGSAEAGCTMIVLLHGYAMSAADLAPFAHSLNLPALYLFPDGPLPAIPTGRSWFAMDAQARQTAQKAGPRDLAAYRPADLRPARERLGAFLRASEARFRPGRTLLGGFSQGGMLACDGVLHQTVAVDGLMLLSASRLDIESWQARARGLEGLPVLVSHGEHDPDLAFSAGLALRDFVGTAGGKVSWVPFDGGHEIPLPVWRAIRKFLRPFTPG